MQSFYSLLERIGNHLSKEEVRLLLSLTENKIPDIVKQNIHNGEDLLLALAAAGMWTDQNFPPLLHMMRIIGRYDLLHMLELDVKPRVNLDQISNQSDSHEGGKASSENSKSQNIESKKRRLKASRRGNNNDQSLPEEPPSKRIRPSSEQLESEKGDDKESQSEKYTCDVQLRVRVECNKLESLLEGAVSSNKNDPVERALELFTQASTVLLSRDLGYIVCNIKFSELSYLDAFWRDYLNGSLQEALKDVFITDALKRTVGTDDLVLLASVSEEDYRKGRQMLMQNHVEGSHST